MRIELVPVLRLGWLVYWGESNALFHTKKRPALSQARRIARTMKASLRIHKRNGRFQEERTYPRSKDPRRSQG